MLSARVELHACLHLLADRARFITGADWAGIALHEDGKFVYRAAAGNGAPDVETHADLRALESSRSVAERKSIVVTVIRDEKTEGFVQIVSGRREFVDQDLRSVMRMAEMITTALDHMDAAQHSEQVIARLAERPPKPEGAILWHARDGGALPSSYKPVAFAANATVSLESCRSCGFPVSHGRSICVDCEERGAKPSSELFGGEKAESWISAHGYTIASIFVSAAVAALYYWLR